VRTFKLLRMSSDRLLPVSWINFSKHAIEHRRSKYLWRGFSFQSWIKSNIYSWL